MRKLPVYSGELIEQLDHDEGPLRITKNTPDKEAFWMAARRELINELLFRLEHDKETHQVLES